VRWSPDDAQGRRPYSYTVYGWDKYGAGLRPAVIAGTVFTSVNGAPITKSLYNNGRAVTTTEANLTVEDFAMVKVDPFFAHTYPQPNGFYNQYGSDAGEAWITINKRDSQSSWHSLIVPPGAPLLISANRNSAGSGGKITRPVVGPPVLSDDLLSKGTTFESIEAGYDFKTGMASSAENGNLITYAFINPSAADPQGLDTPPAARGLVDLSAFVGSGQLARWADGSLTSDAAAPGYFVEVEPPAAFGTDYAVDYAGIMHGVGAGGLVAGADAIQVVMPSVSQSAFYNVDRTNDPALPFPSAAYPAARGWLNSLVDPKFAPQYANGKSNFNPIVLPINDKQPAGTAAELALKEGFQYAFEVGPGGSPNYTLLTLKRQVADDGEYRDTAVSGSPTVPARYPYWAMERTGVPTRAVSSASGFTDDGASADVEVVHESDWDGADGTFGDFRAAIDRTAFAAFLGGLQPYPATGGSSVVLSNVSDTLQVVSYVSGASLGPDGHQGLPVLLEFGDLNSNPAGLSAPGAFSGRYDLGLLPVPRPLPAVWNTPIDADRSAPVASYVARYALPGSGLSGSMGLVTADIGNAAGISPDAVSPSFAPVRNLRVTDGGAYGTGAASSTYRGDGVSVAVSGWYNSEADGGAGAWGEAAPEAANGIVVGAYNDGGTDHCAVWLSWDNPAPGAISGCVVDFFDATGPIDSSSLPVYRVHVGPSLGAFPIPYSWLPRLGLTQGGDFSLAPVSGATSVAVRVRAVRYGDRERYVRAPRPLAPYSKISL
jgi:hypothetical protein